MFVFLREVWLDLVGALGRKVPQGDRDHRLNGVPKAVGCRHVQQVIGVLEPALVTTAISGNASAGRNAKSNRQYDFRSSEDSSLRFT